MNPVALVWFEFAACVTVIGVAGVNLSRYGDAVAAQTGLSRNWVGLVLMATVTSLPELVTGLSAVTLVAAPNIAVGNALGACVFNLATLAVIDLVYRQGAMYAVASAGHALTAGFGIILLSVAALTFLLTAQGAMPTVGHVSLGSVALFLLYGMAMRALYLTEQRKHSPSTLERTPGALKSALMGYAVASSVIVGAGIWLPFISVRLAAVMGWSDSFVGTLFVALATTVPELATTWGAVRIGAIDLALGNLLGSNLFDLLILGLDDLAYVAGPIYAHVTPVHAVSALTACLMSGVFIVALTYRPASRVWRTASAASLTLLMLYLLNAGFLYLHGR